jgi:hypothetical protein
VNELFKKSARSGGCVVMNDDASERKSATEMCDIKHALTVPKTDGLRTEYIPASGERGVP